MAPASSGANARESFFLPDAGLMVRSSIAAPTGQNKGVRVSL
jgi:hypothetical protein